MAIDGGRDIALKARTLTVVQTRQTGSDGQWIVKGPKSDAGRRTIAIPAVMMPALKNHVRTYVGPSPDSLVLSGIGGGPLYPHVLQSAWNKARLTIGREDLHLHDMRHTGGTLVASTGAGLTEVMSPHGSFHAASIADPSARHRRAGPVHC